MKKVKKHDDGQKNVLEFGETLNEQNEVHYTLKLYVTGTTPQSSKAIENINKICEEYLNERFTLDVIDLYKHPHLAAGEQIIAAPTLIKQLPPPLRRIIGDMSNIERVLVGLDLKRVDFPKTGNNG